MLQNKHKEGIFQAPQILMLKVCWNYLMGHIQKKKQFLLTVPIGETFKQFTVTANN